MDVLANTEPEPLHPPRFLTPQQVALMCGLSTDAIYRAIDSGDLPALRLCSRLRIHEHEFEQWMDAHTIRRTEVPRDRPLY